MGQDQLSLYSPETLKRELMVHESPEMYVSHLALGAANCGVDGVICSPKEASLVRETCGEDFIIFTPGIRFSGKEERDQARVGTPRGSRKAFASSM